MCFLGIVQSVVSNRGEWCGRPLRRSGGCPDGDSGVGTIL